jgi:hypothetical protein
MMYLGRKPKNFGNIGMILTFRKGFFAALGIIYMILWAQAGNAQLLRRR